MDGQQDQHLTFVTDEKGDAQFGLRSPPPEWVTVHAHIDENHWLSENQLSFRTEELLNRGVTAGALLGRKDRARASRIAKPAQGELVFMVEPMTFWLRIRLLLLASDW